MYVQCVSDYVGLVRVRPLSQDIRRLLYCELLRCSGIHLDESALMSEAHPDNYYSSLIKQTTSPGLCHAFSLLSSFLFLYLFISPFYRTPLPSPPPVAHPPPPALYIYSIPFPRSHLIAICHSQSELFRYRQFPASSAAGVGEIKSKRRGDDETRNEP